jgi:Tfp pilus assembly PilM family ATPase/Tfp pilus assembly protein PilN
MDIENKRMKRKRKAEKSFVIGTRKSAFGIDICKNAVNFVELEKNNRQIKVVRAGCIPLDQAIMKDGLVQDPAALAGALRQLKVTGAFKHGNATLVICAEPVLLQILTLPDSAPGEVKKIIQNEIRQYAVLPLKNVELDYCGLRSSDVQTKRVLVGATQTEHLSAAAKAIEKDNINVKAVEPAITAFIRVCFNKIIKSAGEKNIMLLLVRDDTLNLCVFEKQKLEFLRVKKFETDIVASQQRSNWLRSEVESVIQFYELEKAARAQSWQIFVACCPENKYSVQIAGEIKSQILRQDVEIAAFENSLADIVMDDNACKEIPPVAAGAAMKLLDEGLSGIKLDLLPKEIIAARKDRKEMLIIANVAACLFILLFLYIAMLGKKSISVSRHITTKKQKQTNIDTFELIKSKENIIDKSGRVESYLAALRQVVGKRNCYNWAKFLVELTNITPQTVMIRNLQIKNDSVMKIDGSAVNHKSLNDFVGLLGQSKEISSASLASATQDVKRNSGLINYSIVCYLRAAAGFPTAAAASAATSAPTSAK